MNDHLNISFLRRDLNCVEIGKEKLQLFYLNDKIVNELLDIQAAVDAKDRELVEYLRTHDIKEGIYEGGFKVWEGALDLANFLLSEECAYSLDGKEVLDIGCGAGLLGILAKKKNGSRIVMQDYNEAVLNCFTRNNFNINGVDTDHVEFVHGDWADVANSMQPKQFDVMLTAETIYNEESYAKLHDLMLKTLKDNGCVFLAAKLEYFGVGGSLGGFLFHVRKEGKFRADVQWTSKSAVPRKIVELRKL
ncbi:hypothetical protein L596_018998 [Steinernema carpocapsae]|uniref:protein-histidine N-methyltransferase n=1 Tax=Steinernema carpocapsae TaxID=34508 RepID=A0A4U5N722_STECR|nr:hypothetical protein L596_018998 [Steinernema carpocapsae]